jgi:hypothetical protein
VASAAGLGGFFLWRRLLLEKSSVCLLKDRLEEFSLPSCLKFLNFLEKF